MEETTTETINNLAFIPKKVCDIVYPVGSIFKAIEGIDPNILYEDTIWELIDDSSDNDIVNSYFGTDNLTVEIYDDGSKWVPLNIYDATAGVKYDSYTEALQCTIEGKVSNLYLLQQTHELFKNDSGEYEFRLEYPALTISSGLGTQRWRQTSNPLETQDTVTGYVPISIDYTNNYWGGLSRHLALTDVTQCLLTGCQGNASIYYTIGSYKASTTYGPTAKATGQVLLYVRVPSLEKENLISNEKNLLNYIGCKFWQRIA